MVRRLIASVVLLIAAAAHGADNVHPPRVTSFTPRVVRIEVQYDGQPDPEQGFGFVAGERAGELFIATANHVIRPAGAEGSPRLRVAFESAPATWITAADTGKFSKAEDLALLTIRKPAGMTFEKGCVQPREPQLAKTHVWVIGRDAQWAVSAQNGAISSEPNAQHRFRTDILGINSGTSGAPMLSRRGVVGMVLEFSGLGEASVLDVAFIRAKLAEWGVPSNLRDCKLWETKTLTTTHAFDVCEGPAGIFGIRADCSEQTATRRDLCVTVPAAAIVEKVELAQKWTERTTWETLQPDGGCEWCKFGAIFERPSGETKSVCSQFAQWSSHKTRDARIVVTYKVEADE